MDDSGSWMPKSDIEFGGSRGKEIIDFFVGSDCVGKILVTTLMSND